MSPTPARPRGSGAPLVTDAALDALKVFEYRDDDILIASFPKCGTHWINEVIQLIIHHGDPTKLDERHRRVCLELNNSQDSLIGKQVKPTVELVGNDPSPRVLMTHLRPSFLSEETWKKRIPIIFIFRDPRDVALSAFNFGTTRFFGGKPLVQEASFDKFLEDFLSDEVMYGTWCEHALCYEELATKGEKIMFVTYEDMKKDLTPVVKSIATFIGHEITEEVVAKVVANSTVEAMRKNYQEAAKTQSEGTINLTDFVKTGVAGKSKKEVSEDRWKKLNETFKKRVKDSIYAKRYFEY